MSDSNNFSNNTSQLNSSDSHPELFEIRQRHKIASNTNQPLLLKPNGVPVFQQDQTEMVTEDSANCQFVRTQKQVWNVSEAAKEFDRTVKAHNILIGKKTENTTQIDLLDAAKNSQAFEQVFPVKVLYVKRETVRQSQGRKDESQKVVPLNQRTNPQNIVESGEIANQWNPTQQMAREISLGEISGLFKKQSQLQQRRESGSKQVSDKEKQRRVKVKKEYAEQERLRVKEEGRKKKEESRGREEREEETDQKEGGKLTEGEKEQIRKAAIQNAEYSQNRFKGQFSNLTSQLFTRAKEQLMQDLEKQNQKAVFAHLKREIEKKVAEDFQRRNQMIIQKQKERGPIESLKEKEQREKEARAQMENNMERERRRQLREMRRQEDKIKNLGLDQIDYRKVQEVQEEKQQRQIEEMEQERVRREQENIKKQRQLREQEELKERLQKRDQKISHTETDDIEGNEDKQAQIIQSKKEVLREQKERRRLEMLLKEQEEIERKMAQDQRMRDLEQRLNEQRLALAKRKRREAKRQAKKEEFKKEEVKKEKKEVKSTQLEGLREWIEQQLLNPQCDMFSSDLSPKSGTQQIKRSPVKKQQSILKNKESIPGNNRLDQEQTKSVGVREDRYGLHSHSLQFDEAVREQRVREGLTQQNSQCLVLEGTNKSHIQKNQEQEKTKGKKEQRAILNLAISEVKNVQIVPGVVNIKEEAERVRLEEERREREAVIVIQKWGRGMMDRMRVRKLRSYMKQEIEAEYADFAYNFKMNDQFNLKKFIAIKQKQRAKNMTESLDDESISEQIAASGSLGNDIPMESHLKSLPLSQTPEVMKNNAVNGFKQHHDPLSIIDIFIKRNNLLPPAQPPIAIPAPRPRQIDKRVKPVKPVVIKKQKGEKKESEDYSSDFHSDLISESLPKESGEVDESIQEESHLLISKPSSKPLQKSISESIPEMIGSEDKKSESMIEEDIPVAVQTQSAEEQISEESYLKESQSSDSKPAPPSKADKIRQIIVEDYENDGKPKIKSLSEREKEMKQQVERSTAGRLRIGKERIDDFERRKAVDIGLYDQFQTVVQMLAQKEVAIVGDRMRQLEIEAKHKEEIAEMRNEQVKMMQKVVQLLLSKQGQQGETKVVKNVLASMGLQEKVDEGVVQKQEEELLQSVQNIIQASHKYREDSIRESIEMERHSRSGRYSSVSHSKNQMGKLHQRINSVRSQNGVDEIEEDIKGSESSIAESIIKSEIEEDKVLPNARRQLGSEESIKVHSKRVLGKEVDKKGKSVFEKNSFQEYQESKFKELLLQDGGQMEQFLDKIEKAVEKHSKTEREKLEDQFFRRTISREEYRRKSDQIQGWINNERKEIEEKRQRVKDTCKEIGVFVQKIEQDKKFALDALNSSDNSPVSESHSFLSSREMKDAKMQLDRLKRQREDEPEVRYLKKKKEYAAKLMKEKEKAIERGLRERMSEMEGEMVDELMQAALQLDVQAEIDKRMEQARHLVETAKIDDSRNNLCVTSRSNKKNVKFQSPQRSKGGSSGAHSESVKDSNSRGHAPSPPLYDDGIGESIKIDESVGHSSKRSGKGVKGNQGKPLAQKKVSEPVDELEEEDSLARLEEEEEYSEDFYQSSKTNKSLKSKRISDVEESQAYTETFEEPSKEIEEDLEEVSEFHEEGSRSILSKTSRSAQSKKSRPQPIVESATSDFEADKEINESSGSVDWQIQLQNPVRAREGSPKSSQQQSQKSEGSGESTPGEAEEDRRISETEEIEEEDYDQDIDQESEDLNMEAERITDELLGQILQDFKQDTRVKMEVDDVKLEEMEDLWPFVLEKIAAQREEEQRMREEQMKKEQDKQKQQQQQVVKKPEKQESELKKQHDEMVRKFEEQKKFIQDQEKMVTHYLEFIIQQVHPSTIQEALSRPIERDPLKVLEKIQVFDPEEEAEMTNLTYSHVNQAIPPYLFDDIEARYVQINPNPDQNPISSQAINKHHFAVFEAFNEALDQDRPYKVKGLPNPWSKQTRITNEDVSEVQVEKIIEGAKKRVLEWNRTGAGTRLTPPPPLPPSIADLEQQTGFQFESDENRNKAERQEKLGQLLTKEVHQKEEEWLDYEIEDTQVRFDLADMILEELALEVAGFLVQKQQEK